MWFVVGLGNPGREYAGTRHNLGFMVVDELLRRQGVVARRGAGDFDSAEVCIGNQPAWLVKPRTYVNRSGRVLAQLATLHGEFAAAALLVVVDDVYLPFGRLRLRPSGSAGGHNGMKSLLAALGTDAFARLRLGVGAPGDATPLPDHVLGEFTAEERAALPEFVNRGADAVEQILELGVDKALPGVNAPDPS